MPQTRIIGRLMAALFGGLLVALLGWCAFGSRLPGAVAIAGFWIASATIAFGAPNGGKAWRRVLLLAAILSFISAWAVWAAVVGGTPEAVQANRSENAMGLGFFVLLGAMALIVLGPAFFVVLGVVLAAIAYFVGRRPAQDDDDE